MSKASLSLHHLPHFKINPVNHQGCLSNSLSRRTQQDPLRGEKKINRTAGCKRRVKTSPLAYSLIQHLPRQPSRVSADLWAPSHTLFYNTINKSGVMNSLVTRSSFSSTLRLSRLATAPPLLLQPLPLQPLHFNKTMECLAASVHLGKPQRDWWLRASAIV